MLKTFTIPVTFLYSIASFCYSRFDGEKLITDMTKKTPVEDVTAGRCNYYSYCRKAKDDCRKLKNVLINVAGTSENPHYVSCPYYYQFY